MSCGSSMLAMIFSSPPQRAPSFYYYTSDPQASSAYNLENIRVGYQRGSWTTSLWVRNVFDTRYAQNGFYFGLIPPNYPSQAFL